MKIYIKITALILSVLFFAAPLFSCANITPPVTEPVTEPATDPVTDPVTEPITEPVTEPITEPVTEPITEPVAEPVTEPVTEPVNTDAATTEPASDAPIITTEIPITTEAPVTTEVPIITEAPETTAPETEEIIDTYGKPLSEVLYLAESGSVMIKGSDTFFLPAQGSYKMENYFVVEISPKLNDNSLSIKFDKSSYTQEIPSVFIDNAGTPVTDKNYRRSIYTAAGMVACIVWEETASYIFTVFPDGTYNAYTTCAKVLAVDYFDENTGLAVIKNEDNGNVFDLYCTYDGGKTFNLHSTVDNFGGEFSSVQMAASRYGYFFLAVEGGRYEQSVYGQQLVLKVHNGQISEVADVSDIRLYVGRKRNSRLYIEDSLGVWSIIESNYDGRINNNGEHCVSYFITTDGGASWQRYDPALITAENDNT